MCSYVIFFNVGGRLCAHLLNLLTITSQVASECQILPASTVLAGAKQGSIVMLSLEGLISRPVNMSCNSGIH